MLRHNRFLGSHPTAPVARFRANDFGLYDMHGNVWEWCSDGYDKEYYKHSPVDDPQGAAQAAHRVDRGGGWYLDPRFCRSAFRDRFSPVVRLGDLGFRLALVQSGR
jgi:formylglycine-generating enzyme required for sulfatase activity